VSIVPRSWRRVVGPSAHLALAVALGAGAGAGAAPAQARSVEEAEAAWEIGRRDDAARLIRDWISDNPEGIRSARAAALLARTASDPAEASGLWDEVLALEGRGALAAEARFAKGMVAYSSGLYVAATREFTRLRTELRDWFDPGRASLWLGYAHLGADQPEEALEAFQEAERGANDPNDVASAELGIAHAQFRMGRVREALRRYDRFEADHSRDGRASAAAQRAVECLRALGQESDAKVRAARIATKYPNSTEATLARAEIRTLKDREVRWREGEAGIDEAPRGPFVVQVASFSEVRNAVELKRRINALGIRDLRLEPAEGPEGPVHRVMLGPYDDEVTARAIADSVAALGGLNPRVLHHAAR